MVNEAAGIGFEPGNFRSINGILKLIEFLCDLLAVILCGAASGVVGGSGHRGFFLFVSILALIITFFIIIIMLLNVQAVLLRGRWPMIELIWCGFIALFYFIASIVIATIANRNGTYGGAAFFGFAAFITYTADAITQFRTNRSSSYADNAAQYGGGQQYQPDQPPPRSQPTY